MDPDSDPDPAIFAIDLEDVNKKLIFNTIFSAYYFLKVHLHHFSKEKTFTYLDRNFTWVRVFWKIELL